MESDIGFVKNARNLIVYLNETERYVWRGEFLSLYGGLILSRNINEDFSRTYSLMMQIIQDIWNIEILINRLEWTRKKACDDEYLNKNWMSFASVDIEHFFIEIRAIMDYVAEIIVCTAKKRGQLPKKVSKTASFEELRNWVLESPSNKARLGKEMSDIIESAKWFSSVRSIRDALIHSGGFALVFMEPKDGILFQVSKGFKNYVKHGIVMYNDNVAYFDRFATIYISYLLLFLERFAKAVSSILQLKHFDSSPRSGFSEVLVQWMDSFINLNAL